VSRDSLTGVDDTKWYAAISIRIKDGSGGADGGVDFRTVLADITNFETDVESFNCRWALRRDTVPDNPTWVQSPDDIKDGETALKYDISAVDVQDASGNLTGDFIDGGYLDSNETVDKQNNSEDANYRITDGSTVTLLFKAAPGELGDLRNIVLKWNERW